MFPHATPLHLSRVLPALARAGFATEHVYGFTTDYPETLTHWLTRLEDHLDEAVRLAGEQRVRVWGIYLRGAQRVPDGFHVGLPSPRAFVLKDWRLLPLGTAGRTAVLKLFAHSSLRSGARGATARPADPGALSAGVRDPRAVRPRPRGEHEHEPGVAARAPARRSLARTARGNRCHRSRCCHPAQSRPRCRRRAGSALVDLMFL